MDFIKFSMGIFRASFYLTREAIRDAASGNIPEYFPPIQEAVDEFLDLAMKMAEDPNYRP